MGCGESPALPNLTDYSDEEQVNDLYALLMEQVVDITLPTYLLGHSYGPNWIYKLLLRLRQFRDDDDHDDTRNNLHTMNLQGLILISSGVADPKYSLQTGGPALFRVIPLWLLRCLQPLLTQSFLHMGFSPNTHRVNPTLIAMAKGSNNQNNMTIVCRYYQSHDWITAEDIVAIQRQDLSPRPQRPPLILHGEDDQILPVQCGQDLCNAWGGVHATPVPLTIIPHASHMVLLEQPQNVAQLIHQYLLEGA
jgi:pimeloyl-ACP methyl ester carboxylesterase